MGDDLAGLAQPLDGRETARLAGVRVHDDDTGAGRARHADQTGGGIDNGESPREACIREVREETGLTATVATELWSFPWTKEFKRDTVHMFVVHVMGTIQVDGDEVLEARWFNRRRLPADIDTIAELAMNYINSVA